MSEPVLERSVLERKERDELQTIAKALGAHPTSRLRKAELVDLILRTAGIGPESTDDAPAAAPPAPSRGRGRRAAAASGSSADQPGGTAASEEGGDAPEAAGDSTADGDDGRLPGTEVAPAAQEGARRDEAARDRDRGGDQGGGRNGDRDRGGDRAPGQDRGGDRTGDQPRGGDRDPAPAGDRDRGDRNASSRPQEDRPRPSAGDDRGGDRNASSRPQEDRPRPSAGDDRGGDRNGRGQGGSDRGNGGQGRAGGGQQGDGGQGRAGGGQQGDGGQQGTQQQGAPQGGQQGDEGEGGNRRRRRRNRDRGDSQGGPDSAGGDDAFTGEPVACAGLLDLRDEGYGFLRVKGYLPHKDDVYVSVRQVRQLGLRKGDHLTGASRPANRQEKNPALLRIDLVNGQEPDEARRRPRFEDLTPLFPDDKLRLETGTDPTNMTARIVDLISPIGKGQRGLIVSPPKAGKTTILKQIVKSIERNNPDVHLMVLLVDERPEEVTDMRRSTGGEVIASTFDRPSEEHTAVSELAIERAKRLVEEGRDVVVVLDGITRLARAYNLAAPGTGRIMSGGIDTGALYPPKRFFGAARNVEEGGSLTILATALIETGSKMDEVIFEEFKGTGNMELRLDRRLAERRIYPAIDVDASSTRHEELLFSRQQLQQVWRVRRALHALSTDAGSPAAALERLMDGMKTFKTNDEFLSEAARAGGPAA